MLNSGITASYLFTMASTSEVLVVVVVALLVVSVSRMLFKQHKKLPPGPIPLPVIGSLHLLGTHPHQNLAMLATKYGPLMSLQLGQKLCIAATSPETAKEFLKIQDPNFSSRPYFRCRELILPNSMVLNNNTSVFRHLRKILVSELMSAKRLQASKHVRGEELAYMLRTISEDTGSVITLKTYLNVMASNILSRMILNKRFKAGGDSDELWEDENVVQEFTNIVEEEKVCFSAIHPQDFFSVPKWFDPQGLDARCRKLRGRMDVFYESMMRQHRELRRRNPISEDEKTLLDVLLDQLEIQEHQVTEEHLKGIIWDAFSAGTETTMITIEWAMAEVLRKPTLMKEAQSELDRVVGSLRMVQESDIPNLKYIQAIVKEALRLHAPLPMLIFHQGTHACKAFGYDIPAETRLLVNHWGIARDAKVWENPLEFVPERFLEGGAQASTDFQGQHYELLPFGSGRRSCPGMGLAAIAMHLQVASLLHAFDWELPEDVDMSEGQGLTIMLATPLNVIARTRLPSHLYQW